MEMKKTKQKHVTLAEAFNRLVNEYQLELPTKLKEYPFECIEPNQFELDLWEISDELTNLLIRKHADYGPKNISQSPGGPLNGLRVRMWDKIARINNLIDNGKDAKNESLEDSFADLANYSIIAIMVLKGKWPND